MYTCLQNVRGTTTVSTQEIDEEAARLQAELNKLTARERELDGFLGSLNHTLKNVLNAPENKQLGACIWLVGWFCLFCCSSYTLYFFF